jgi:sterol desaturase/sphingolipid hydroxylase (fatty acid hydroxylase superfamily)
LDHSLFTLINALGIGTLLLLEMRSSVFRRVWTDARRMRRNLAFLIASVGAALLMHRSAAHLYPVMPRLHWQAPLWLQLPLVFMLAELMNWTLHWAKHQNGYLWRFHCQHHKEDQYSVWLVAHTYAPEVLLSGTVISATVLSFGFSKLALDGYLLFYSIANVYQHSSLPYSLGWLDKLIVNPAYHRHHHAGDRANFGSTLTIWDWVFRSARWPSSWRERVNPPPVDVTPEPFGFVDEMLYPLKPSRWVESQLMAAKQASEFPE